MSQPGTHDFSLWLEMRGDCAAEINLKINAFDYGLLNSVSKPPRSCVTYDLFHIYLPG